MPAIDRLGDAPLPLQKALRVTASENKHSPDGAPTPSLANQAAAPERARWKMRLGLGLGLVVAAAIAYFAFGRYLTIEALVAQEEALRDFQRRQPTTAHAAAFIVYVLVTGLSLPGAALLTILYGWLFGAIRGVLLVSFASTLGASIAFSASRYLFRDVIQQRYQARLETLNQAIETEGAYYLFTLRLIPVIPFFLVNLLMGLTPIRLTTFWWVSQLGMLAGTIVYVSAGASLPSMRAIQAEGVGAVVQWPTLAALALLGLMPLLTKQAVGLFRRPNG